MADGNTYSFLDTHVAIVGAGGAFSLKSGISEEGITITMDEDKSTKQNGANGDWLYSLHAGKGASVTVSVLKNSQSNTLLNGMYNFQQNSSLTWGKNVITINTLSGDNIILSGVAFKKLPDVTYAKDATLHQWSFDAGSVDMLLADFVG